MRFFSLGFVTFAAVIMISGGCQQKREGPLSVEGTVTFLGRPLTGGLIVMTPDHGRGLSGKPIVARIQTDGTYALNAKEMSPGWYRVTISDPASWNVVEGFPAALRSPDRSGLQRQLLAGREHRFDYHIDATR